MSCLINSVSGDCSGAQSHLSCHASQWTFFLIKLLKLSTFEAALQMISSKNMSRREIHSLEYFSHSHLIVCTHISISTTNVCCLFCQSIFFVGEFINGCDESSGKFMERSRSRASIRIEENESSRCGSCVWSGGNRVIRAARFIAEFSQQSKVEFKFH